MKLPPLPLLLAITTTTTTLTTALQITTHSDGSLQAWNSPDNTNEEAPAYSLLESPHTQLAIAAPAPASKCCFKGNKCYRALEAKSGKGFCKKYTKTTFKEPAAMGPYKQSCWNNPQKLSSACSCFAPTKTPPPHDGKGKGSGGGGGGGGSGDDNAYDPKPADKYSEYESDDYAYPSKPMCGPPGSPCTIDNFVDVCCTNVNGSVGCSFPAGDPQFGICFL